MKTYSTRTALALGVIALSAIAVASSARIAPEFTDFWGRRFGASSTRRSEAPLRIAPEGGGVTESIRHWNAVAVDATGLDHTPPDEGETRVFGEQLGPGRASRAMAIVHIAVFDAVNAVARRYRSYTGVGAPRVRTSTSSAIAQAAHDALSALFLSQAANFDAQLAAQLASVRDRDARAAGIALGRQAAAAILALRA